MKCIHCLQEFTKTTKDHVFPSSWYPENTPTSVQRWTVPSCSDCNGKFGTLEKELFIRLAMCVDPRKAEASGISKNALKSLGVDVAVFFTIECAGITVKGAEHIHMDKIGLIDRIGVAWRPLASAVLIQEKLANKLGGQPLRLVPAP